MERPAGQGGRSALRRLLEQVGRRSCGPGPQESGTAGIREHLHHPPAGSIGSCGPNGLSGSVITGQARGARTERGSALSLAGCHQPHSRVRT